MPSAPPIMLPPPSLKPGSGQSQQFKQQVAYKPPPGVGPGRVLIRDPNDVTPSSTPRYQTRPLEMLPPSGPSSPDLPPEMANDLFDLFSGRGGGASGPGAPTAPPARPVIPPLPEILTKLSNLIGLDEVKEIMNGINDHLEMNKLREEQGLPAHPFKPHALFMGNPGNGKSSVGELYAQLLAHHKIISTGQVVTVSREELMAEFLGQPGRKLKDVIHEAKGGVLYIDEHTLLAEGGGGEYDFESLAALADLLAKKNSDTVLVLAGESQRLEQLLAKSPNIASQIGPRIPFADLDRDQLAELLKQKATEHQYELPENVVEKAADLLAKESGKPGFSNAWAVERVLGEAVRHQSSRIRKATDEGGQMSPAGGLTETDFFPATDKNVNRAEKAMDRLERMSGLKDIKEQVRQIQSSALLNQWRVKNKLPVEKSANHAFFVGNPGTGKTEVARVIADILADSGQLSKGHLVEASRKDLVGGHVGETALKTQEVIDKAIGGVLVVDEAYALAKGGDKDYGAEAMATLIKAMEDHRDDLVVIFAGYPKEMKELMDLNPGLKSRVNINLKFKDYTANEVMEIFERKVEDAGYELDAKAYKVAAQRVLAEAAKFNGGNGRAARAVLESAIKRQADRVRKDYQSTGNEPDRATLMKLTAQDFPTFNPSAAAAT